MNIFMKYKLFFDENADSAADNNDVENKSGTPDAKKDASSDDVDKKSEKKYSDEDLDKIIAKKLEKWQKQKSAEIDEAKKLASMTEQERAEHERDQLKAELDELKRQRTVSEMEKTVRGILSEQNINSIPDDIISILVRNDADETSKNTKAFIKSFKAAVQAEVKNQLAGKTPKTGAGSQAVTRDTIKNEKDPLKRQALIRQNMGLYKH